MARGPEGVALTWFDERDGNREVHLVVVDEMSALSGWTRRRRGTRHDDAR